MSVSCSDTYILFCHILSRWVGFHMRLRSSNSSSQVCLNRTESRGSASRIGDSTKMSAPAIQRFGYSAVMNLPARPGRVEPNHRENTVKLVCLLQGSNYTPVMHKEHNIGFSTLLKLNTAAHDLAVSVPEHLG